MNLFTPLSEINPTTTQELLYAYTGPAPVAYGTRTRAVLENIIRPYQYFYKEPNVQRALDIKTGCKEPEDINVEGPSSGFHTASVLKLADNFFRKYRPAMEKLKYWILVKLPKLKYAELSKGRQTYSFIHKRNLPAPIALEETVEFLEQNLRRKIGPTLLSYCQAIADVMELDETTYEGARDPRPWDIQLEEIDSDEEDPLFRQVGREETYTIKFSREELWDQMRTLNTMWKHLERGRLNRRTIATPSMLIRGFVKIVEDAAKEILENVPTSGVPVGGEEKLAKLASKQTFHTAVTGELSGDQEKFNECLDPDAMRLMWTVFLRKLGCPDWIMELFNIPFMVFKSKLADMGEGLVYTKGKLTDRKPLGEMPSEFDDLVRNVVGNSISCRLGMFMGMYNLTSTLLALISIEREELTGSHVESSDDFIHFFNCKTHEEMFKQAETLRLTLKLVGINMSPSKCILISPAGIGEFNSKFHHRDFVGNVATELPALVPNGTNPMTDLAMGLNVIKHSVNTGQMNLCTGALAMRIFNHAYKYAYMALGVTRRTRFMEENAITPLLTNQGASPVHSFSTMHLDEVALRRHLGLLDEETLRRILNPNNPVTQKGDPSMFFRIENKMPQIMEDYSVPSCFKYTLSRNRTIQDKPHKALLNKEERYQRVTSIINKLFPEVLIQEASAPGTVRESLKRRLELVVERSDLDEERKKRILSRIF
uniref:RNA-directed RNA polymerase catalytic subunit n=2 Tax=Thogotovirus thogotoense TaxID=11569 RepID=A0A7M1I6S2_9ORTO|nr:PB1 protein [Thogotovirus thogotoense]